LFLSDVSGASKWQGSLSCESAVFLRVSLFPPCTGVPTWNAVPECWPNYESIRTTMHWAKRLIPKTCKPKR
jgi:hypothetical protein